MATLAYLRATEPTTRPAWSGCSSLVTSGVALYLMDELSTAAASSWTPDVWKPLDDAAAIVSVNVAADSSAGGRGRSLVPTDVARS